jgi:uncharacterized protein
MRIVFGDASFWSALVNPKDSLHVKARILLQSLGHTRIITSEMVLTELLNQLSGRGRALREAAVDLVEDLQGDPEISIVSQTSLQFQEALSLYAKRRDKEWGHTDCSSFQIMVREGLTQALTHDHHFVQAGFQALLRDPS